MKKEDKVLIIAGIVVIAIILVVLLMLPEDLTGKPTAVLSTQSIEGMPVFMRNCLESIFPDPSRLPREGTYTFTFQTKENVQITSVPPGKVQMISDNVFRVSNVDAGDRINVRCARGSANYVIGFA